MKLNLELLFCMVCGGLAGWGGVYFLVSGNPLYIIPIIPTFVWLSWNLYRIRKLKAKMRKIKKDFKDKYGFDMFDIEALERYLEEKVKK